MCVRVCEREKERERARENECAHTEFQKGQRCQTSLELEIQVITLSDLSARNQNQGPPEKPHTLGTAESSLQPKCSFKHGPGF